MASIRAEQSKLIPSTRSAIYAILSDYRNGHPRILPKDVFTSLTVESGGVGDGTVISFEMASFGSVRKFRARISTPEPERRLVEADLATGIVTTFLLEPDAASGYTRVTISTQWERNGLQGVIEALFAPAFLRGVYEKELELLKTAAISIE